MKGLRIVAECYFLFICIVSLPGHSIYIFHFLTIGGNVCTVYCLMMLLLVGSCLVELWK